MVAVEVEEHFVFDDPGDATFADKLLLHPEVTLFHIGEIEIDDQFYLIIHLMLEDTLDIGIVKFCQLDDSMGYFSSLAVPIGDEIFGFVHIPEVKVVMVLDPVFAKFSSHCLALQPHSLRYTPDDND